jgi:hypothetical protein
MKPQNQTTELVNPAPPDVTCNDGTKDITNGKKAPCVSNGGVKMTSVAVNVPQGVGQAKRTFLDEHKNHLIMIGVPLGFYAFSKYQKYDSKKTLKVTIIGSVVVFGAIFINAMSGFGSGNTYTKRLFGKQNAPKQIQLIREPV